VTDEVDKIEFPKMAKIAALVYGTSSTAGSIPLKGFGLWALVLGPTRDERPKTRDRVTRTSISRS
jgi:hypothetical protein